MSFSSNAKRSHEAHHTTTGFVAFAASRVEERGNVLSITPRRGWSRRRSSAPTDHLVTLAAHQFLAINNYLIFFCTLCSPSLLSYFHPRHMQWHDLFHIFEVVITSFRGNKFWFKHCMQLKRWGNCILGKNQKWHLTHGLTWYWIVWLGVVNIRWKRASQGQEIFRV